MQVYVRSNFLSAPKAAAKKIGDIPCRRFLPPLALRLEYYTLRDELVQPINDRYTQYTPYIYSYCIIMPQGVAARGIR